MKKKAMALVLALGLVTVGIVGGTMAWLTAEATEVKNVFTDSDINITLTESDTDPNEEGVQHDYKMIPGHTIAKDPMVTLDKDSEACYLFIKVKEDLGAWSADGKNFTDYLNYSVDTDVWKAVEGQTGIYYKEVDTAVLDAANNDLTFKIIKDDTITVSGENVTKDMMDAIDGDNETEPTLTFEAAAVQLYKNQDTKFSVSEAYGKVTWPSDNP